MKIEDTSRNTLEGCRYTYKAHLRGLGQINIFRATAGTKNIVSVLKTQQPALPRYYSIAVPQSVKIKLYT
jgi:hypothetical protein